MKKKEDPNGIPGQNFEGKKKRMSKRKNGRKREYHGWAWREESQSPLHKRPQKRDSGTPPAPPSWLRGRWESGHEFIQHSPGTQERPRDETWHRKSRAAIQWDVQEQGAWTWISVSKVLRSLCTFDDLTNITGCRQQTRAQATPKCQLKPVKGDEYLFVARISEGGTKTTSLMLVAVRWQ